MRNIAVLGKGWLGGGDAGRKPDSSRANYLWEESEAIYEHARKLWERLSQVLNYNVMYSPRGVMMLAHSVHDVQVFKRPLEHLHVVDAVGQHHHPARGVHHVVVQHLRETLPELPRVLVDRLALLPKVVRAAAIGFSARIAAPEPALPQHGDVPHPVLGGEVVGRGEPVPAGSDDDGIVRSFRLGRAPLRAPALMAGKRLAKQGCERELHSSKPLEQALDAPA